MNVFISYSHDDSGLVDQIVSALEEIKVKHFRDIEHIRLGEPISGRVTEELGNCQAILVVVSAASLRSHWVPYEIGRAIALAKPLIPFVTDAALRAIAP